MFIYVFFDRSELLNGYTLEIFVGRLCPKPLEAMVNKDSYSFQLFQAIRHGELIKRKPTFLPA